MTASTPPSSIWSFLAGVALGAVLVGLLGLSASTASAHDPGPQVPSRWRPGSAQSFAFTSSFPGGSYRARVTDGWSAWNARNQGITFAESPGRADFDPNACTGDSVSAVHWRNLQDTPSFDIYGLTVACGSAGQLWSAQVIFDSDQAWYTGTGTPSWGQIDLWSSATHEFGHAAGMSHFSSADRSICGVHNDAETMCAVYGPGLVGGRTLGAHDIHTFDAAYTPTVFMRNGLLSGGQAALPFRFGTDGDQIVACDWDGNGTDTVASYRNGVFAVRSTNDGGPGWPIPFGDPGDQPVCGDWDGDGVDSIGVFRRGAFYLRNTSSSGPADLAFGYGSPGDRPIVGDWNGPTGGAADTVGVVRDTSFFLRDTNTAGSADRTFTYGNPTDRPLAGNWTARPDKADSPAVVRG